MKFYALLLAGMILLGGSPIVAALLPGTQGGFMYTGIVGAVMILAAIAGELDDEE
jgi:hypothetical protein